MALPDATATYSIELRDGTSGAAVQAAEALRKLRDQIDVDVASLRGMQKAMKNLQGSTSVNIDQFRELQKQLISKQAAVAKAQGAYVLLGGTFAAKAKSTQTATEFLQKMQGRLGGVTTGAKAAETAVATTNEKMRALQQVAMGLNPRIGTLASRLVNFHRGAASVNLVLVAGVAAFVALAVGVSVAVVALARYGLALGDVRRAEQLRLQGLVVLRAGAAGSAAGSIAIQDSIDRVAASSALGREQIAKYGEELYRSGLRGAALEAALEGTATTAVVLGAESAKSFARVASGAAAAGKSVAALAQKVKNDLGGIAAEHLISLSVQAQKQKENFAALFSGLRVGAALKGLANFRDLLSQNTASGRALKAILKTVVQPVLDGFAAAMPIAKRFFQGLLIIALRLGIGFLTIRNAIKKTFGKSVLGDIDLATAALRTGQFVALVVAAALLAVAAPFLLVGTAIWSVINTSRLLYQVWQEMPWRDIGTSILGFVGEFLQAVISIGVGIPRGIVKGIKAGVSWVVDAMKGLGAAAWGAFRDALGISSPSKVFARLSLAIPQGAAVGIEAGAPAVRVAAGNLAETGKRSFSAEAAREPKAPDAARAIGAGKRSFSAEAARDITGSSPRFAVAAPTSPGEAPITSAQRRATASASSSVTIQELHVHTESTRPRDLARDIKRELEEILGGLAVQLGAPSPEGV